MALIVLTSSLNISVISYFFVIVINAAKTMLYNIISHIYTSISRTDTGNLFKSCSLYIYWMLG